MFIKQNISYPFYVGLFVALLFFALLMGKLTLPYLSFDTEISFLLTKQGILHNKFWYWSFYLHITTSLFVLAAGLTQFNNQWLKNRVNLHRNIGKLYVFFVLFLSCPSGFIMALYANGGVPAKVSFVFTSLLWWIFTFFAYTSIRKKDVVQHRQMMIRSYALTLSAISLRIYTYIFPMISDLYGKDLYILVAWLSWVPNLIVAEMLIKRTSK